MRILGISAYYHDSAAVLLDGRRHHRGCAGRALHAQEARSALSRRTRSTIAWRKAGISLSDVDLVAFYDKPFLKFERLLETYLAFAPKGFTSFRKALPIWLREKLFQKDLLCKELTGMAPGVKWADRLLFSEHHESHAASAFYPSPFDEAVVLTMDGVGEWTTTSVGDRPRQQHGDDARDCTSRIRSACSIRRSPITPASASIPANTRSWVSRPMASRNTPTRSCDKLMDVKEDGTFRLDQSYFDYCTGLTMTNDKFDELFGGPPRNPEVDRSRSATWTSPPPSRWRPRKSCCGSRARSRARPA